MFVKKPPSFVDVSFIKPEKFAKRDGQGTSLALVFWDKWIVQGFPGSSR